MGKSARTEKKELQKFKRWIAVKLFTIGLDVGDVGGSNPVNRNRRYPMNPNYAVHLVISRISKLRPIKFLSLPFFAFQNA